MLVNRQSKVASILRAEDLAIFEGNRAFAEPLHVGRPNLGNRERLQEGNVNYKKDFERLCRIDPDEVSTMSALIDRLRALSHGEYRNCYFLDERGRKIFVRLILEKESDDRERISGANER